MYILHPFTVDISVPVVPALAGFELVSGEKNSHVVEITVTNAGTPVSMEAATTMLDVVRLDGTTVAVEMTATENVVSVALPIEAGAIPGRIRIKVFVTQDGADLVILDKYTTVRDGITGTVVDPGTAIPSLGDIIAEFAALEAVAEQAEAAAAAITGITAEAGIVLDSDEATAFAETDPEDGHINLAFGIPRARRRWSGTAITGASETPTAYVTGIEFACKDDEYAYNGSDEAEKTRIYVCTLSGNEATALWKYDRNDRGAKGDKGDKGDTGSGLVIIATKVDYATLLSEVPSPSAGAAYAVGASAPYDIYISDGTSWTNHGPISGADGASAYVHIRWGTNLTPETLLTAPNDYIGIASTDNATAPADYTGYDWYKYKGETGNAGTSAYVHIRWGESATPATLLTAPDAYIGIASTNNATAPADYTGYAWYKYKGDPGETITPSDANPTMNGTVAPGTSSDYSRADHVHPKDTTKLGLAGGDMTGAINEALVASMALAGTMNIGAAAGNYIIVTTGTGPIVSFDNAPAGARRFMRFSVAATINYNATTMLIPGAVNLNVVSGDVLEWVSGGGGVWRCVNIERWERSQAHTAALPTTGWSGSGPYTYAASVTGVTADNVVLAGPAPASKTLYEAAQAYPSAQGAGTLTFTAANVPTAEITVNVVILNF